MSNAEQIIINYHRARGDSKVRLRGEVLTARGPIYLVRFYNDRGSCYSSLDTMDENGVVLELDRCHQLDERKMLNEELRRRSHETDRQ